MRIRKAANETKIHPGKTIKQQTKKGDEQKTHLVKVLVKMENGNT